MRHARSLVFIALAVASLVGCQPTTTSKPDAGAAELSGQLLALGNAYHSFHMKHKKGPANWDEAMASGDSTAISALRDKDCLVAWGMRFRDATGGTATFVLAYPPSTLTDGGPVLFLDGSVLPAKPGPLKTLLESQADVGVPE